MTTTIGNGEHATPPVVRTNRARDPRATNAALWNFVNGTGGVVTETPVSGATDGPVLPDGSQATTYMRYTWTTAATGGIAGAYFRSTAGDVPLTAGATWAGAVYARSSVNLPAGQLQLADRLAGAMVGTATQVAAPLVAGVWTRIGTVAAVETTMDGAEILAYTSGVARPLNSTLDLVLAFIETDATSLGDHLDGAMSDTVQFDYAWAGTVNDSASTRTARRTVQPLAVLTAGYERAAGTLLHEPLDPTEGPVSPDVTLRPATSRAGSLDLFFASEADALEADALHTGPRVMTLVDDVNANKSMTYVVAGGNLTVRREVPYSRWVVTVPFREVLS